MAWRRIILLIHSQAIVPLLLIFLHFAACSDETEAEILLRFKDSLQNAGALSNWNMTTDPCSSNEKNNWVGVICDHEGSVWGLRLQSMGLEGTIDVDAMAKLTDLRTVSFMNNNFDGSLPNLTGIPGLKSIYLSNNKFSGEVPFNSFQGMLSLKKLYLANNQFSGPIPLSLAALPRLAELELEGNHFEGEIPEFSPETLKSLNLSNNELVGEIPPTLGSFNASTFSGNKDLCGAPLQSCTRPNHLTVGTIIMVSILVASASAALVAVFVILRRRKEPLQPEGTAAATTHVEQRSEDGDLDKMEQGQSDSGSSSPEKSGCGKKSGPSLKIMFLKEDRDHFDMSDLLKASAEILGSGMFGSTYKTTLNDGQMMAVKRFKHMNNVNKEEFYEHMRRLGRVSHPNLLPIVGFYYRKEEKLLITDYAEKSSLAFHLHGKKSQDRPNWPTRLNIVKGVSKGLLHLYNELPSITTPHGHLKSSNVLLDGSYTALLTDYGLVPVVNQEHAQENMISYKSPEYKHSKRISKKTDVWSLGILILEILTAKFPSNFLQQGQGNDADMATWVESVVRDRDNADVFDSDMARAEKCEGEMMKILKIGLSCCQEDVSSRPSIQEAVEWIEEVKEEQV